MKKSTKIAILIFALCLFFRPQAICAAEKEEKARDKKAAPKEAAKPLKDAKTIEINSLKDALSSLRSENSSLKKEISGLRLDLQRKAQMEVNSLKKELNSKKEKNISLEAEIAKFNKDIKGLNSENILLKLKLAEKEKQPSLKPEDLANLNKQIKEKTNLAANLEKDLGRMNKEAASLKQQLTSKDREISKRGEDAAASGREKDSLSKEISALSVQLKERESINLKLNSDKVALSAEISRANSEKAALSKQNASLSETIGEKDKLIAQLTKKNSDGQANLETKAAKSSLLEHEVSNLKEELTNVIEEKTKRESESVLLKKQLERQRAESDSIVRGLRGKNDVLVKTINEKAGKEETAKAKIEALDKNSRENKVAADNLQSQVSNFKTEILDKDKELKKISQDLNKITAEKEMQGNIIKAKDGEKVKLEKNIKDLKLELEKVNLVKLTLEEDVARLRKSQNAKSASSDTADSKLKEPPIAEAVLPKENIQNVMYTQVMADGELVKMHLAKANAYAQSGDYTAAKKETEEALKIDFQNEEAAALLEKIDNILNVLK